MMNWLSSLVLVLAGVCLASTSSILVLVPMPAPSHAILFNRLSAELASRGHQVTLVSCFKQPKPIANLTEVVLPYNMQQFMKNMNMDIMSMRQRSSLMGMFFLPLIGDLMGEAFFSTPEVQDLMKQKFDLVLGEVFFDEAILAGFAHINKAPLVGFSTSMPTLWAQNLVGNPSPMSYIPDMFLGFPQRMSFCQRVANTLVGVVSEALHDLMHYPWQDALMRKHFGDDMPHITNILLNTSLVLANYHHSLGFPRPYVPNLIDVAGIHFGPPKELPQDLKKYLDESKNGVILFSLGSNLKSSSLPREKLNMFIDGLSRLKQNVLWKFEDDSLTDLPKNIMISKWLPQSDILAHPNLKLFITHGGLLSTIEAVDRGVPVVGIPIFAEQPVNMRQAENAGFGRALVYEDITADSLEAMINEVIDNPKYRENVKLRSQLLKDTPLPPLETAVYWIEYVLRHKGAPHLRSAAQDLNWFQLYLVDVTAVLLLAAAGVIAIQFYLVRLVYRKLFNKKKVSAAKKSN